ncbi:MAG: GAF domain-containing protein, partial [Sandaracinaceae bacterium]
PAAQPAPSQPPAAQPALSQPPAARRSEPAPRGVDDRLANAFEALQDLFFLTTPVEGLDFVLELLADLVPSEASSACLYDINSDELRFVALRGPGAPERQGEGVPRLSGLMGAAATSSEGVLLSENVPHDVRFDPGVDGRIGLEPVTMALMSVTHQGRLLGMIQLINRQQQAQFSRADANLIAYVSEKLGEFLYSARMRSDQRRA